ncbi:hypothetical protein IID24_05255 [Patescibacteria group bacterium]|nr:hypothetical protein [Patescibacteria group bacterium]
MISAMLLTLLGRETFIQDRGERFYVFGNYTINIIQISTTGYGREKEIRPPY